MIQAVLRGRDGANRFGLRDLLRSLDKMDPAGRVDGLLKLVRPAGTAVWASYLHNQMIQRDRDRNGGKYRI